MPSWKILRNSLYLAMWCLCPTDLPSAQPAPANPQKQACISIATDAKPVDCLIYQPLYYADPNGRVNMGVCIYLGVHMPPFWSTVIPHLLDYNWVQVYTTNYDPTKRNCSGDRPHTDPCVPIRLRAATSPLYRPGDEDEAFTGSSARQWGMTYVFRDMPSRSLNSIQKRGLDKTGFRWESSLDFVLVPHGDQMSYKPIENISYGFTIQNSILTVKPLVIDGKKVIGQQTRSLKDPPDRYDAGNQQNNACIPYPAYVKRLESPPPGYIPPTGSVASPPQPSRTVVPKPAPAYGGHLGLRSLTPPVSPQPHP